MAGTVETIIRDTRLSTEARIITLELATRGEGWHEVSHEEWSMLLNQAGRDRVRTALRQVELAGVVERKAGGQGHADCFRIAPGDSGPYSDTPLGSSPLTGDYPPDSPGPNAIDDGNDGPYGASGGGLQGGEEVDGGRSTPPDVPPAGVTEDAQTALEQHGDLFAGCRDSLGDYLRQRVPSDRQYGYVQTLAGWRNWTDRGVWGKPDGGHIDGEDHCRFIASGLNELLATDEREMRRPVGDPGNLRTKINILIQNEYDPPSGRRKNGNGYGDADARGAPGEAGGKAEGGRYDRLAVHSD